MLNVSVIIPTWNRREFLVRAVESALSQKEVSFEILVCDDGSTDGSCEMIRAWKDDRVHLLAGPRAGRPAIPRNRGIAAAQGEWLAFLDDDDEWLPDKLRIQLDAATHCNACAVCSNALRRIPGQGLDTLYFSSMPETLTFKDLVRVNMVIASSVLVHRSLFLNVGGFPEEERLRAVEDYALWLRIAAITPFVCVETPLLIYRDAPEQSIRNQDSSENERQAHVFADYLCWWAKNTHGPFWPALQRFLRFRFSVVYDTIKHVERLLRRGISACFFT